MEKINQVDETKYNKRNKKEAKIRTSTHKNNMYPLNMSIT